MRQPAPARIGDAAEDVDTPALLIDLDAFERNLDKMAAFAKDAGVRLRPHSKTHKSAHGPHRRDVTHILRKLSCFFFEILSFS